MIVASIVGTRPQFIKLAPLSSEIRERFDEIIIHTGQHYDTEMTDLFFKELSIPEPDYNLQVGSGSHGYQTGKMLRGIERILIKEDPDVVLVFGDSNSTLAGALAAAKLHIPVGHVEAGMRTFEPYLPEEINRVCTDHISQLLFAITPGTVSNLRNEGIPSGNIYLTGSTIVDACFEFSGLAEKNSNILEELNVHSDSYFLFTAHRPENVDYKASLQMIIDVLLKLPQTVVFPLHPRTEKSLERFNLMNTLRTLEEVIITPPLGYLDFLKLTNHALLTISDSGSIQQEAMALRKKVVRMRSPAPFPELKEYRGVRSVKLDSDSILHAVVDLLTEDHLRSYENPLGEGDASRRIAEVLENWKIF